MSDLWSSFILTFIPLFIVIDALGNVPFVVALTGKMPQAERLKVIHQSTLTATAVGLAFLFFGQFILGVLGITVGSFAIAGGLVLLILSIRYMITGQIVEAVKEEMVAVVPIGTPLTVGPATITTLILLTMQHGLPMVLFSFILNMALVWISLLASGYLARFLGLGGLKAVSKVFSLLLAAIAVSMIFRGFEMLGILKPGG